MKIVSRAVGVLVAVIVIVWITRPQSKTIVASTLDGSISIELPPGWTQEHDPIVDKEQTSFYHQETETVLGMRSKPLPLKDDEDPKLAIEKVKTWEGSKSLINVNGVLQKLKVSDKGQTKLFSGLAMINNQDGIVFMLVLTADTQVSDEIVKVVENAILNCSTTETKSR